ncbi:MAG: hypothetical protein M1318_00210 [Firmicutes bacterium]|jgi:hypothetical protein|nr:hypothetical protein [Bacillota bacterium]
MARIVLDEDQVHIDLSFADKVLSFSGSLRVPYSHIKSISTDPVSPDWYHGIQIGTNLPPFKVASTFITEEGNIFYDFHDPHRCITLDLEHERYVRIVVEIEASQSLSSLVEEIRAHVEKSHKKVGQS